MYKLKIKSVTAATTLALAAFSAASTQGAGGNKAANYFYKVAPRNGAVLSHLSNSAALQQVL